VIGRPSIGCLGLCVKAGVVPADAESVPGVEVRIDAPSSLDLVQQTAVAEMRTARHGGLVQRDRLAVALLGGGFLLISGLLAALVPTDRSPSFVAVFGLVIAYGLVSRIEFELGSGSLIPTQLLLVPMLFALPLGWVPFAVAAAYVGGSTVDAARGQIHPERVLLRLIDSWHVIGPVLVLAIAGERAPSWDDWPIYLAALLAQYLFEFASCAIRERLLNGLPATTLLRLMARSQLADAALAPIGLAIALAAPGDPLGVVLALPLIALLRVFARERQARIGNELELSTAYRGTAFLLGDVVEADDAYTGQHSRHVVDLVLGVADELGLAPRERRRAELTALLHDVGKIRIPTEIIRKPGSLTAAERAVIETHTIEGEKMLEQVGGLLGEVGTIVRSCHERWDGGGYPDGLAGEDIPLVARIVCCCDAFSAMTTDRPYRTARTEEAALEDLRLNAGTQFDPAVVSALEGIVARARE
jgi:HD-GYP domain-containing protein (c-di-GMP phosphodiesterase class II)